MEFRRAEPNQELVLGRWVSTGGQWNLGFRQMLFGVRVSLYPTEAGWFTLDYCAGDDTAFAIRLLAVMAAILERFPEDVTEQELQAAFPWYEVKPINLDPACWQRLQAMAGLIDLSKVPSISCPTCRRETYNPDYIEQQFCRYCHKTIDQDGGVHGAAERIASR